MIDANIHEVENRRVGTIFAPLWFFIGGLSMIVALMGLPLVNEISGVGTSMSTSTTTFRSASTSSDTLLLQFQQTRAQTVTLCDPLLIEDYQLQSMPDCSPPKWHLAHTTWFYETFLLKPYEHDYQPANEAYNYLFNSYYNSQGERWPRPARGLLSRPSVAEVYAYRHAVDLRMAQLLKEASRELLDELSPIMVLGLAHEEQHQELLLTDLKHALALNPLQPAYLERETDEPHCEPLHQDWLEHPGGIQTIGHAEPTFSFDNESPRHDVLLQSHAIAARCVTVGEYLEFINDGGYDNPSHWLSDGWTERTNQQWDSPLYWRYMDGVWTTMALHGRMPLNLDEPVCHVSFYEADAYARWTGYRLPSEAEWEVAAEHDSGSGCFLESNSYHPMIETESQFLGNVWEWTASPYGPYPGYRAAPSALGEYNGKFMCNQMVLRGGSCLTPRRHIRSTYRNFFRPADRWQFSGIRLARDLS